MRQTQKQTHHSPRREVTEDAPPTTRTVAELDVDGLLDEINQVLEPNAEEFVNGFKQKGGQ